MWDGSIVPFGEEIVKDDGHRVFEVGSHFASGLIDLVEYIDGYSQTGLGVGVGDELADDLNAFEDNALTSPGNVGKEAMFNGIVFGAIGRIMSNADFNANVIDKCL